MEVNRLAELRKRAGKAGATDGDAANGGAGGGGSDDKDADAMSAHVRQYDSIKEKLNDIRRNTSTIERLKDKERTTVNEAELREIMAMLDRVMENTTADGRLIKNKLDSIKADNDKYTKTNPNSATLQMRLNLYHTHLRRLNQVMNGYNQASHDFKKALKDRTRRQLAYVDQNIPQEKLDEIIDSGHAEQVLSEVLISEELDDVVRDIENRHQGIIKLEQQVQEVYQLFQDLATLVDMQQETLDHIEHRVSLAKGYAEKAQEELVKGEEYQVKARRRLICIMMILLGVAITVIVIFTQFND